MRAQDFLRSLNKRKSQRKKAKSSKSVQQCPSRYGDVFIGTYFLTTYEPIQGISVQLDGTTKTTDKMGIAEFLDKEPGSYAYTIDWAASAHANSLIEGGQGTVAVVGGGVASSNSGVRPTGRLKVEVRLENADGLAGELVPVADVLKIFANGEAYVGVNTVTIPDLPVATYQVSANVKTDRYEPHTNVAQSAEVKPDAEATAVVIVTEMTWLEVKVVEAGSGAKVEGVSLELVYANRHPTFAFTNAAGLARIALPKLDDKFRLKSAASQESGKKFYLAEDFT